MFMRKLIEKNRYIILVAMVLLQMCTAFPSIWGVFQQSAAEVYGITLQEAGNIFPMCVAFYGLFYVVGGKMQDSFDTRITAIIGAVCLSAAVFFLSVHENGTTYVELVLKFALPFGGGCALVNAAGYNVMFKWFPEKKGMATGIAGSVSSLFLVALTYASNYMLEVFGMQISMKIYGISFFIISVLCCLVIINPTLQFTNEKIAKANVNSKAAPIKVVDYTPSEVLKNKQFYLLFFGGFFTSPAYTLMVGSVVTIGLSKGLSQTMAVSAITIGTASSAVGKYIVPAISDKIGRKKASVIFLTFVLLSSISVLFTSGVLFLISYGVLMFTHSGWGFLVTPFMNDMYGFKHAGVNGGLINFHSTLASFTFSSLLVALSPVFGMNTNSYIGIVCTVIGVVLIAMINPNTAKDKEEIEVKV